MAWEATLTINNNTDYNIDVVHNLPEGLLVTLKPEETGWSWTTDDNNNTIALRFWKEPNVYYMQGSVSYGPLAGIWVDRGWMDPNGQFIMMVAEAGGKTIQQTTNGGNALLAWDEFEDGGEIVVTFNPQDPSVWK